MDNVLLSSHAEMWAYALIAHLGVLDGVVVPASKLCIQFVRVRLMPGASIAALVLIRRSRQDRRDFAIMEQPSSIDELSHLLLRVD